MVLVRTQFYMYVLADGVTRRPCICVHHDDGQDSTLGDFQVFLDSATTEQGIGVNGVAFVQDVPFATYDQVNRVGTPNSWGS